MSNANTTQAAPTSSDVELTGKGRAYAEANTLSSLCHDLDNLIELAIALRDRLDPDADMEPDLEDEPGTWTENQNSRESCKVENQDLEDNADDEPCVTDFGHDADYQGA